MEVFCFPDIGEIDIIHRKISHSSHMRNHGIIVRKGEHDGYSCLHLFIDQNPLRTHISAL